jgi:hypothetical protein
MLVDAASATFLAAAALGARRAFGAGGTLLRQPALQVDLAAALAQHWCEQLHQRADARIDVLLLLVREMCRRWRAQLPVTDTHHTLKASIDR